MARNGRETAIWSVANFGDQSLLPAGRGIIIRLPRPPFLKVLLFMPRKLAWQKLLVIGFVKPYEDFYIRNNFTLTLMKLLTKFQNNNYFKIFIF